MNANPSSALCGPQVCAPVRFDRSELGRLLSSAMGAEAANDLVAADSTWFPDSPVFLDADTHDELVAAAKSVYAALLRLAHQERTAVGGPTGVLHGLDFHLSDVGPRLIEVNTNSGGVLLAHHLARAQAACCQPIADRLPSDEELRMLPKQLIAMFAREWELHQKERGSTPHTLRSVAIVDDDPTSQALYPEMRLYRSLFESAGITAQVLDPRELEAREDALFSGATKIDLVYNRITDFSLSEAKHALLRGAWERGQVALTPSPNHYRVLADKRRLVDLGDQDLLQRAGVSETDRTFLRRIVPNTTPVDSRLPDDLWAHRKELFFKPIDGYGSRGAYDGRKLTRRVFEAIVGTDEDSFGPYVAQRRVEPSRIPVRIDGEERELKVDFRVVVYDGEAIFTLARLYSGQTTNLRTPGGGLAPVYRVS